MFKNVLNQVMVLFITPISNFHPMRRWAKWLSRNWEYTSDNPGYTLVDRTYDVPRGVPKRVTAIRMYSKYRCQSAGNMNSNSRSSFVSNFLLINAHECPEQSYRHALRAGEMGVAERGIAMDIYCAGMQVSILTTH